MKYSKHKLIKQYLLNGNELSGLSALNLFNVYRLSSVINRLRNEGLDIKTTMIQDDKSDVFYAIYFINKN